MAAGGGAARPTASVNCASSIATIWSIAFVVLPPRRQRDGPPHLAGPSWRSTGCRLRGSVSHQGHARAQAVGVAKVHVAQLAHDVLQVGGVAALVEEVLLRLDADIRDDEEGERAYT